MNKTDLVAAVACSTGSTKVAAEKNVNAVIDALADALIVGETIRLEGFASFVPGVRAPRAGRNPHSGEVIQLSPKPYVRVKLHQQILGVMSVYR